MFVFDAAECSPSAKRSAYASGLADSISLIRTEAGQNYVPNSHSPCRSQTDTSLKNWDHEASDVVPNSDGSPLPPSQPSSGTGSPSTPDPASPAISTLAPSLIAVAGLSAQDVAEEKREQLLSLCLDVVRRCPICWYQGVDHGSHWAYYCPSGLCGQSKEWKEFKRTLHFTGDLVCVQCGVPFGPPFFHGSPPPGRTMPTGKCTYSDLLKEITFLIYTGDPVVREAIFSKLGVRLPPSIGRYAYWLAQANTSGLLLNFVDILATYWTLRCEGI
jgi:hypothetical protein